MLILVSGILFLAGCKGKKHNGDLAFTVDTAQLKAMDSMAAAQRRNDSDLLKKANSTPGYNAGLANLAVPTPAGWRRYDTLLGNIRALILDTASTSARFNINVSVVSDSLRGVSIDNYEKGALNSMVQYVPAFSLIGQGKRVLDSDSARWLHYSQDREGEAIESICYLVPARGVVYIVTCSTLKGRLLQSRPAFETVVANLHVR